MKYNSPDTIYHKSAEKLKQIGLKLIERDFLTINLDIHEDAYMPPVFVPKPVVEPEIMLVRRVFIGLSQEAADRLCVDGREPPGPCRQGEEEVPEAECPRRHRRSQSNACHAGRELKQE